MEKVKNEKIVYLVRHGQSEGNISRNFQSPESPLTENGKKQAELIAERIASLNFAVLISSPLARARETAEIITKVTGKKPEYSDLFTEAIQPTSIIGKSRDDDQANRLGDEWGKSLQASGIRIKDGENFEDIIARADKALEFLKNREEKTITIVTHGFFLRTIIARVILGNSLTSEIFKNFQRGVSTMENTGLSVIKYGLRNSEADEEEIWRLLIYNDHAHLAD